MVVPLGNEDLRYPEEDEASVPWQSRSLATDEFDNRNVGIAFVRSEGWFSWLKSKGLLWCIMSGSIYLLYRQPLVRMVRLAS